MISKTKQLHVSLHNEKTHNSGVSDQLSEEVQTFLDLMIFVLSMRGIRAVFNNGTDTYYIFSGWPGLLKNRLREMLTRQPQTLFLISFHVFFSFAVLEMYSKLKEQLESKRYQSPKAFQHNDV